MKREIIKSIIVIPLLLGLTTVFLRNIEKRVIFYPSRSIDINPERLGLNFEEVSFYSSDKYKLYGWLITAKEAKYTILFCNGNAGNMSYRVEKAKFFNQLSCNVLLFDYRGYGKSKGSPSERGLYKDVSAAYCYLLKRGIEPGRIIGYGESLGGAVIIDLALSHKLGGLILDSTFSSIEDVIKLRYPLIPSRVFSSKFNSVYKIKSIIPPKLIIHSIDDEIIPFRLGKKLYEVSPEPKDFLQVRGGHNSNFYESQDILKKGIGDFIEKLQEGHHD